MEFRSKNMNYIFHVEYFQGVDLMAEKKPKETKKDGKKKPSVFQERNEAIRRFRFNLSQPYAELRGVAGFCSFELYTGYPGLLIGTGNPHDVKQEEAIKLGFTFDYVTGLPCYPGSSLKGLLRSYFSEPDLIRAYLGRGADLDVETLKREAFEGASVYLGAFPVESDDGTLMEMEYITPHLSKFKNPNPLSFVKVKPNVGFEFCFILHDAPESGVTAKELRDLFQKLVLEMGIGAKTNVGFGRMTERKAQPNKTGFDDSVLRLLSGTQSRPLSRGGSQSRTSRVLGKCPKCNSDVVGGGKWPRCTGNCGMRFGDIHRQHMPSDEEYRTLLSGGAIRAELTDRNGVLKARSVRLDGWQPAKNAPDIFYPRWRIGWTE